MKKGASEKNIPPPYRSYSSYLKERFGEKVHRIALDPGFGCPHRKKPRGSGGCIYCGPSGSGSGAYDRGLSIHEQMARGIQGLSKSGVKKYLAYFQAFCGTGAPIEVLRRAYLEAVSLPGVVGLSVGTRPDMVSEEVLQLLNGFARGEETGQTLDVWLELGLQTAHNKTLERILRGHDVECFNDTVHRTQGFGLSVAAHIILGLPGENEEMMWATADHLAKLPVKGVKLHHLFVEEDTELAKFYLKGKFKTLPLENYIRIAIGFIRRLKSKVIIMRLAGRAGENKLISPRWKHHPGAIAQKIETEMKKAGFHQGDLCQHLMGHDLGDGD